MRTAIDSNVLLDVLKPDPRHLEASIAALEAASERGAVVVCEIVWAEGGGGFEDREEWERAARSVGVGLVSTSEEAAWAAGRAWVEYRRAGGKRTRVVADMLIGAHALHHADELLTRDRGYYRRYFPSLQVRSP